MRLKLQLYSTKQQILPINYQYQLMASVYKLLSYGDKQYAEFLHNQGYELNAKRYKLFVFSSLFPKSYKVQGNNFIISPGSTTFYISTWEKEFFLNFTQGVFKNVPFKIATALFDIQSVELISLPCFDEIVKLKCISPITISTKKQIDGKLKKRDCNIIDPIFKENIKKNIINKYKLINGVEPVDRNLDINFDYNDIQKNRRGKLIDYKGIKIKGYLCPFTVIGNKKLIELMWQVGVGEKNSAGFGMVDIEEGISKQ